MYFQTAKISYESPFTSHLIQMFTKACDAVNGILISPTCGAFIPKKLGKAHRQPNLLRVLYVQISEFPARQALRWRLSGDQRGHLILDNSK